MAWLAEWTFEGGPELTVGTDGDRNRYPGGIYVSI